MRHPLPDGHGDVRPTAALTRHPHHSSGALHFAGTNATAAGLLHLLADHSVDEVPDLVEGDLPTDWFALLMAEASDAVADHDLGEFIFDADFSLAFDGDVETTISAASVGGRERLATFVAARVALLPRPTLAIVCGGTDATGPYYGQFIVTDHGVVAEVVSNEGLPATHRLDDAAHQRVLHHGWHPPDPAHVNYWRDELGDVDVAATACGHVDLTALVARVLDTLHDGHGIGDDQPLELTLTVTELDFDVIDGRIRTTPRIDPDHPARLEQGPHENGPLDETRFGPLAIEAPDRDEVRLCPDDAVVTWQHAEREWQIVVGHRHYITRRFLSRTPERLEFVTVGGAHVILRPPIPRDAVRAGLATYELPRALLAQLVLGTTDPGDLYAAVSGDEVVTLVQASPIGLSIRTQLHWWPVVDRPGLPDDVRYVRLDDGEPAADLLSAFDDADAQGEHVSAAFLVQSDPPRVLDSLP